MYVLFLLKNENLNSKHLIKCLIIYSSLLNQENSQECHNCHMFYCLKIKGNLS